MKFPTISNFIAMLLNLDAVKLSKCVMMILLNLGGETPTNIGDEQIYEVLQLLRIQET